MPQDFATLFRAVPDQAQRLAAEAARQAAGMAAPRVLDLGCGDGSATLLVSQMLPGASIVGLDISGPNIAAAKENAQARGSGKLEFVLADYMQAELGTFDLILSGSTLHLIAAPPAAILDQLARQLRPGGAVVATLPRSCAYNAVLILLRRLFRALRCPLLDRLVFLAGRVMTRGRHSAEFLRERLGYMYVIPGLLDGPQLRKALAQRGLLVVHAEPEPHASLAQPKHVMLVLRKEEGR